MRAERTEVHSLLFCFILLLLLVGFNFRQEEYLASAVVKHINMTDNTALGKQFSSMESVDIPLSVKSEGGEEVNNASNNASPDDTTKETDKAWSDVPKGVIIRGKIFNPSPQEIDLYGSIQLHHSVSHSDPDVAHVRKLLTDFPGGAAKQNQFGRIPLHYVLDRAVPSLPVTKLLVEADPQGACVVDDEGNTPYDLAVHWHHPRKILRLLLKCNRHQDLEMWRRLEYGYLYDVFNCLCCWKVTRRASAGEGGDDATQRDDDNSDQMLKA